MCSIRVRPAAGSSQFRVNLLPSGSVFSLLLMIGMSSEYIQNYLFRWTVILVCRSSLWGGQYQPKSYVASFLMMKRKCNGEDKQKLTNKGMGKQKGSKKVWKGGERRDSWRVRVTILLTVLWEEATGLLWVACWSFVSGWESMKSV